MADDGLNSKFDRKNKRYKQQRDKRRRGKGGAKGADNAGWDDRKSKGYDEIVKENALLDTYYKVGEARNRNE